MRRRLQESLRKHRALTKSLGTEESSTVPSPVSEQLKNSLTDFVCGTGLFSYKDKEDLWSVRFHTMKPENIYNLKDSERDLLSILQSPLCVCVYVHAHTCVPTVQVPLTEPHLTRPDGELLHKEGSVIS